MKFHGISYLWNKIVFTIFFQFLSLLSILILIKAHLYVRLSDLANYLQLTIMQFIPINADR